MVIPMDKRTEHLLKDWKDAFIYSSPYIKEDSQEVRARIQEQMAAANCQRIFAMIPLFLGLDIYALAALFPEMKQWRLHTSADDVVFALPPQLVFGAALLLMAALIGYGVVFFKIFYLHAPQKHPFSHQQIYRSFWRVWIACMAFISIWHVLTRKGIILYLLTCFIVCLVPLCSPTDMLHVTLGIGLLAGSILSLIGTDGGNFWELLAVTLVMLVIGFVAQHCETEMWTLREYLYVSSCLDPLTHLLNRRGGNLLLEQELSLHSGRAQLGILMLDIDFFKKYNDSLGHDAGDFCLNSVADCIKSAMDKQTQMIIRHGGEEFVVILPHADKENTAQWAEKIRSAVAAMGLPAPHKETADVVTVSIGGAVVTVSEESTRYETLLAEADLALYEAKENGRNQVVMH